MNAYLLDTNAAVTLINGHVAPFESILNESVAISTVTAYELTVGLEKSTHTRTKTETRLFLQAVDILDFDFEAARESALVRVELEQQGKGIGPYDTLIAGHCRVLNRTLVTGNTREFERVKGLSILGFRDQSR